MLYSNQKLMNTHVLDDLDLNILSLLEKNSLLSHTDIGVQLNKSVNPIHARVRWLKKEGYIKNYTVIVDHKKVGKGLISYTQVQIKDHSQESLTAFQNEAVKINEVMECYHMTGAFDFLLKIAIRDMDEYQKLFMNKLSKLPDVGTIQSFFVMSAAKYETGYVLKS